MEITIASYITITRILLAPFVVYAIIQQQWAQVILLFALAMVTDFLDGFVARRYQQESKLGQLLDPIADKVLIVSALYALMYNFDDIVVRYAIIFLISKEWLLVVGGAILHYRYAMFIKPSRLSRAASVAEMIGVILLTIMLYVRNILPTVVVWITDFLRAHSVVPNSILHILIMVPCILSVALLVRYSFVILSMLKRT